MIHNQSCLNFFCIQRWCEHKKHYSCTLLHSCTPATIVLVVETLTHCFAFCYNLTFTDSVGEWRPKHCFLHLLNGLFSNCLHCWNPFSLLPTMMDSNLRLDMSLILLLCSCTLALLSCSCTHITGHGCVEETKRIKTVEADLKSDHHQENLQAKIFQTISVKESA